MAYQPSCAMYQPLNNNVAGVTAYRCGVSQCGNICGVTAAYLNNAQRRCMATSVLKRMSSASSGSPPALT